MWCIWRLTASSSTRHAPKLHGAREYAITLRPRIGGRQPPRGSGARRRRRHPDGQRRRPSWISRGRNGWCSRDAIRAWAISKAVKAYWVCRAFQEAGARTVINSLWPVDDREAQSWMAALYRARFVAGKSTAESIRDADLETLRARRIEGRSTHPFYWAGFRSRGDWR